MRVKLKAAAIIVGAVASVGLAGTAFAHGKPSVHKTVNVQKTTNECDVSVGCDDLNHSLNRNLSGNLSHDHVNVLSGNLNHDKVLSGNNVNAPVTIAPDFCGSPVALLAGSQRGVCIGNFHQINAGQNVNSGAFRPR